MADRVSYGPFTLYESDAYKQAKALESAKKELEYEKLKLDLEQKKQETPDAKIALAEDMAIRQEALKQKQQGIEFGDVAKKAALDQGMNLLQASKEQGAADIQNRMLYARGQAIENILAGGKGLVPTEKYNYQGISGTTLRGQGSEQMSSVRRNVYQADYNDFYDMAKFQGADDQQAHQMAIQKAEQKAIKNTDKVTILLPGMGTFTSSPEKINQMRDDPSTPENIRSAIVQQWGPGNKQTAQGWIKSRLPAGK